MWAVGVDVGGTFTDVVAADFVDGRIITTKVSSIPSDPATGVLRALGQLLADADGQIAPAEVDFLGHGTTVATNALIERRGATAGLLMTKGFDAVYEMRGGTRPTGGELIDIRYQKPALLVPRHRSFEIGQRTRFDGSSAMALNEQDVRDAIVRLRGLGVSSVAVCFLFSFMDASDEQRVAEILAEELPSCRVSISSEVLPVVREFRRLSTTVVDAYVGPVVGSYLDMLRDGLRGAGMVTPQVYVMQSSGGLMRLEVASRHPNETLLSGPASGVVYAESLARCAPSTDIITFDMGGTSTDLAVLPGGRAAWVSGGEVAGEVIGTPMIAIHTLGAGGGSIAAVGPDGRLKVGPQSAGAEPGPACYGRGGRWATVTDANMVLGYLNPEGLAGGRLAVDPARAASAIDETVAGPLGIRTEEAALGIRRVVNTAMEVDIRLCLMRLGVDARAFSLLAFGGCGPVHAADLASALGLAGVLIPPAPGLACAMGLLATDVHHVYLRSRVARVSALGPEEAGALFRTLEERALSDAAMEAIDPATLSLRRSLDLRYPHQGYELTVPVPEGPLTATSMQQVEATFHELHQLVYGVVSEEEPEIVTARMESTAPRPRVPRRHLATADATRPDALVGRRAVILDVASGSTEVPVFARDRLRAGNTIAGPAIVEQMDSTVVIGRGHQARVDRDANLVMTKATEAS